MSSGRSDERCGPNPSTRVRSLDPTTEQEQVGHRGENVFRVIITRKCGGRRWFSEVMLGEKYPTVDFHVDLLSPTAAKAYCFVQVKATDRGFDGAGPDRRLRVRVTKTDVSRLRRVPAPTYVVGIDVTTDRGAAYIMAIDRGTTQAVNGLRTTHRLDSHAIRRLWREVDAYWVARDMLLARSAFSVA